MTKLKPKDFSVQFYSGYAGNVKCEVTIEGKDYVLELSEVEAIVKNEIIAKGFALSKTPRQKYPRITINQ